MKRARKRAPGAGRPPGEFGPRYSTISVRVPDNMRRTLEMAAKQSGQSLSSEVLARVNATLGRQTTRPAHIRALAELVALAVEAVERETRRRWNSDRYTGQHAVRAVETLITHQLSEARVASEAVIPPAVLAAAEAAPADIRDSYPVMVGGMAAGGVIAWLNMPREELKSYRGFKAEPRYIPEDWYSAWQLKDALTGKDKS